MPPVYFARLGFRAGLLRFRAGLLRFRAGLLSFRAGLLRFRTGLLGFHSDMLRLLPKYLWVLPKYSRLLHNDIASSAPRILFPRVPGVPCGGSGVRPWPVVPQIRKKSMRRHNHKFLVVSEKAERATGHSPRGVLVGLTFKSRRESTEKSPNYDTTCAMNRPRDMASRPSNTHIMAINHVPGLRLAPHRTSKGAILSLSAPTGVYQV